MHAASTAAHPGCPDFLDLKGVVVHNEDIALEDPPSLSGVVAMPFKAHSGRWQPAAVLGRV
jgi:hypothetical protein